MSIYNNQNYAQIKTFIHLKIDIYIDRLLMLKCAESLNAVEKRINLNE